MEEKPCHKCKKPGQYKLVDKEYCKRCFTELVEQKIRQNFRQYNLTKGSTVFISDLPSEYFILNVINIPVKLAKARISAEYTIKPLTLDDDNEEFLSEFLHKKRPENQKKIIRIFLPISKTELSSYCQIKGIYYKPKITEINSMLDKFEAKYPGTKTSIASSEQKLRREKKR